MNRDWVDYLPKPFRTRRGFAALVGAIAFITFTGWNHWHYGQSLGLSVVFAAVSAALAFVFLWWVLGYAKGFDP